MFATRAPLAAVAGRPIPASTSKNQASTQQRHRSHMGPPRVHHIISAHISNPNGQRLLLYTSSQPPQPNQHQHIITTTTITPVPSSLRPLYIISKSPCIPSHHYHYHHLLHPHHQHPQFLVSSSKICISPEVVREVPHAQPSNSLNNDAHLGTSCRRNT